MKSGYPENYRKEVVQSSVIGYERQIAADEAGVTPLYRPRSWNKEERKNKKRLKKSSWYRPADVVLFVPATPEAELANQAREVVEGEGKRLDIKVKVVERGGPTMKQHLVRTDMGRSIPCPGDNCPICLTNPGEGGGAKHHRSGALYSGSCLICPAEV